jgi:hypothetical protein
MKKLLLAVLIVLVFASVGRTAPFLVCDPQAGVTHYTLTGPAWVPVHPTAQADGSLRIDVSTSTIGSNALTVKACIVDATWGEMCSAATPFAFTRPGAPATATNVRLIP